MIIWKSLESLDSLSTKLLLNSLVVVMVHLIPSLKSALPIMLAEVNPSQSRCEMIEIFFSDLIKSEIVCLKYDNDSFRLFTITLIERLQTYISNF